MNWTRTDALALAHNTCTRCFGSGTLRGKRKSEVPCTCVLRSIFRACHARFVECASKDAKLASSTLDHPGGSTQWRGFWGRRDEEYMADYLAVAKRTLTPREHQIFRFHYLLGAEWRLCTRRLGMEKGDFFHIVYRIQQKLGKTFRELKPYPLFPLDDYFNNHSSLSPEELRASVIPIDRDRQGPKPVQPPLKKAA